MRKVGRIPVLDGTGSYAGARETIGCVAENVAGNEGFVLSIDTTTG